jgi:hypothetical protein
MGARVEPFARLTLSRSRKGLQEQMTLLHAEVVRRVKGEVNLLKLNKALR